MALPLLAQPTRQQMAPYCEHGCGRQAMVFRLASVAGTKVCQIVCALCNVEMASESIR